MPDCFVACKKVAARRKEKETREGGGACEGVLVVMNGLLNLSVPSKMADKDCVFGTGARRGLTLRTVKYK